MYRTPFSSRIAVAGLLLMATASQCHADLILQFGQNQLTSSIGQTSFQTSPDSTVLIDFYLTQTGQFGGLDDKRLGTVGLGGFNLDFEITGDGGVVHSADGSFMLDSAFSIADFRTDLTGLPIAIYSTIAPEDPDTGEVDPVFATGGSDSIYLGTASLNVLGSASGIYNLTLSPNAFGGINLGTDVFTPVAASPVSGTLTVIAVPEPSSIVLVGLAMVVGGWRLRRGRTKRS